jgi:hypothetical protein
MRIPPLALRGLVVAGVGFIKATDSSTGNSGPALVTITKRHIIAGCGNCVDDALQPDPRPYIHGSNECPHCLEMCAIMREVVRSAGEPNAALPAIASAPVSV